MILLLYQLSYAAPKTTKGKGDNGYSKLRTGSTQPRFSAQETNFFRDALA
jgi:hypothetical protein